MIQGTGDDRQRDDSLRADFEAFFRASSVALVAQAYALTGNIDAAKDLTQEALTRAWERWAVVSTYESPEAWTRRVVHNLAVSRWRRLQLRRRHEHAMVAVPASGPDAERVDLVRALQHLPIGQRRAVVLHDLAGLTSREVGAELGIEPGTVRVWLHRARR